MVENGKGEKEKKGIAMNNGKKTNTMSNGKKRKNK